MQNRMFNAANILVNRQPPFRNRTIKWLAMRLACKAEEVPAGINEGIQRVGFTACRLEALRAIGLAERRVPIKRVSGDVETDIFGQFYRQFIVGYRHRAACLTMDDGDWCAPITLP